MTGAGETEHAAREAAEWLARLNSRHVPNDVLRQFYDWRRDPDNASAFAKVLQLWESSQALGADADIARAVADALDRAPPRPVFSLLRRAPRARWVAALASVLAVAGAALLWYRAPTLLVTAIGEHRMIILADGTRLHLNTDSRVEVDRFGATRQVRLLRGEAYFEVAHDVAHPFRVRTAGLEIRDVGTRFDVRTEADSARVALVDGRVEVAQEAGDAPPIRLEPGQLLTAQGDRPATVADADMARLLGWTEGRIIFRDATLADAVAEMNRYNALPIELHSGRATTARVNGTFETGNAADFAAAMAALYALRLEHGTDGHIILRD